MGEDKAEMDEMLFKIGEVVRLRVDGSPDMIVDAIDDDGRIICVWTDGAGTLKSHAFPVLSLRAAETSPVKSPTSGT